MRIVDFTSLTLKDLRGQKLRSFLTVFALVISTVILVLMAGISVGGRQAIVDQFGNDAALTAITVTPNQSSGSLSPYGAVQEVNQTASKLTDATVRELATLPNVATVTPRAHVWEFHHFTVDGNAKQFVAQTEGIASDSQLPLKAGASFTSNDDKNTVILGYGYAKELGFTNNSENLIGKTIQITTQKGYRGDGAQIPQAGASKAVNDTFNESDTALPAKIIGVTDIGQDQNSIYVSLGWAHALRTARYAESGGVKAVDQIASDGYSSLELHASSTANVKQVSQAIGNLGFGQISTQAQIERLQQFTTLMWAILGAVALIAVIAAALGVVNTMLMAVSEQRYMIGVWRACGARKGFIMRIFLVEAGILGFIGGVIGSAVGLVASIFVNQYVSVLLQSQNLTVTNIAVIPWWLIAGTIAITSLFGIIAGLYPAYRAARQDPSQTLSSGQ
jgi:putative ABC transport system permease protein